MAALSIQVPYPVFYDRDGQPLDNGNIYIGVANLDPVTNPLQVYYDEALTITASQPLITSGGYVYRNGTPTQLYVNANDFSITVNDSKNLLVYNFPEATGIGVGAASVEYNPPFTGAVTSGYTVSDKLSQTISAKDFGAVGDGIADDTVAIQAAADAANAADQKLYVGAGTYKLTAKVNLYTGLIGDGIDKTFFQAVNNGGRDIEILSILGSGVYEGFTVDGAVSADPPSWNSSNYDSFTGWLGVYVRTDNVTIRNAKAQNTQNSGFAGWEVDYVLLENCSTDRSRGDFGDGIFFFKSKNITHINCSAYDFTRIGFVFDGAVLAAEVGQNAVYINCYAEYGHDRSVLYGGQQENSGFWAENCADVAYTSCRTVNSGVRGFTTYLNFGGTALLKTPNAVFNSCSSENNSPPVATSQTFIGYNLSAGQSTYRGNIVLNSCSTRLVNAGYLCAGDVDVLLNNCAFHLDAGNATSWAIAVEDNGTCRAINFYQHWTNPPATITSTGNSDFAASISAFNDGVATPCAGLYIDNYRTHDGTPCYIKQRIFANGSVNNTLTVKNTKVQFPGFSYYNGNILFENCEVLGAALSYAADKIMFIGCELNLIDDLAIGWFEPLDSCVFESCTLTRTGANYILFYRLAAPSDIFPRFKFSNCSFTGDVENDDYFVKVGGDPVNFEDPGHSNIYTGCTFVNTGGATANYLIDFGPTSLAAGIVYMNGCWKSSTVTDVVKTGWLATGSVVNDIL